MNWQLLFTIAALNLVIWLLHLLAQNADENRGKIQKRNTLISRSGGKKFLYLQDFLIHVWGSLIFLPLIAYAFFGCVYAGVIAVPVYPPRRNRSLSALDRSQQLRLNKVLTAIRI